MTVTPPKKAAATVERMMKSPAQHPLPSAHVTMALVKGLRSRP
jgi:hypothetical protein